MLQLSCELDGPLMFLNWHSKVEVGRSQAMLQTNFFAAALEAHYTGLIRLFRTATAVLS